MDLADTPQVLAQIDSVWKDETSDECRAAESLAQNIVKSMRRRMLVYPDTIDFLIGG
jgi:hypothetical protein